MYNYILQLTIMTSMEFVAGADAKYSLTVLLVALSVSTNTVSPGSVPLVALSAHCTMTNLVPKLCVTVIVVSELLPTVVLKNLLLIIPPFKVAGVITLLVSVPAITSACVANSTTPCVVVVPDSAWNSISLLAPLVIVIAPWLVVLWKLTVSPDATLAPPAVLLPSTFKFQPW